MQKEHSITLLYHFFYPDDVVSARHFSDLAEDLVKYGWKVTVLTSNRYCRYLDSHISNHSEIWRGIEIIRLYRPSLNQAGNISRLCNAFWLFMAWLYVISRRQKTEYYIIGSDPQFSQLLFPFVKILSRKQKIVYWCYDLYPEAIISDSDSSIVKTIAEMIKPLMHICYKSADLIVDLGPCMRKRIDAYSHKAKKITLTPWALQEPHELPTKDEQVRTALFGDGVELGLLYSGNIGKAHNYELFLKVARSLRDLRPGIRFAFACRGNRFKEFQSSLKKEDTNIRIADFAPEEELKKRLAAADVHLISLREDWDGIVVPSKFFGSLAVGRPVLYEGSRNSDIGLWIQNYQCGLILNQENVHEITEQLMHLASNKQVLSNWQQNAFSAYKMHFSRKKIMGDWDQLLRENLFELKAKR